MGRVIFERAWIEDASRGEVALIATFEAAAWNGEAASPSCHLLSGFIAGVFSFAGLDCQAQAPPADASSSKPRPEARVSASERTRVMPRR
jgi:hypothetical protein